MPAAPIPEPRSKTPDGGQIRQKSKPKRKSNRNRQRHSESQTEAASPTTEPLDDAFDQIAVAWDTQERKEAEEGHLPDERDAQSLAAYRLGYLPCCWRYAQRLFWQGPLRGAAFDRDHHVCTTFELLDGALVTLANQISTNVYGEVRRELDEMREFSEEMVGAVYENGSFGSLVPGYHRTPGKNRSQRLLLLTDQALVADPQLLNLGRLGRSLGRCLLQLQDRELDGQACEDCRDATELQTVVQAADALADDYRGLAAVVRRYLLRVMRMGLETQALVKVVLRLHGYIEKVLRRPPRTFTRSTRQLTSRVGKSSMSATEEQMIEEESRECILGLRLIPGRHIVRRDGYEGVEVKFHGQKLLWDLLETMCGKKFYYSQVDLTEKVWNPRGNNRTPADSTIWAAISDLRKKLAPLGVTIESVNGLGYHLIDAPAQ